MESRAVFSHSIRDQIMAQSILREIREKYSPEILLTNVQLELKEEYVEWEFEESPHWNIL